MKRWIAVGLLFVVVAAFACVATMHSEAVAKDSLCCTMWWKPCPLGGHEIGSLQYNGEFWVCGHWGTVCDAYCLIP